MAYTKLNIVRDCWWANPSGNKLCDETGSASTQTNGLYKSLNTSNTSYITFLPSGAYSATAVDAYVGRLESTNIVPDIVQINVTASGNMAGGAECILSINNTVLTPFTLTSETTYSTTTRYIDTTDPATLFSILNGRISDNYDFFKLYFNKNNNETIKVYNVEIFFSGVRTWDNYTAGLPNVLYKYCYPNSLGFRNSSQWVNQAGAAVNPSGYYHISKSPSGVSVDTTYIRHTTPPAYSNSWSAAGATVAPNGGLTMTFEVNTPELLRNGGFDNGLTGWTNNGWDTAEIVGGNLHLVTDGVPNYGCIYQAIDVVIGQRYRLRCSKNNAYCYVKVGQSNGGASLDNGYTDTFTNSTYKDYIFTPVVSPAYVMFVYTTNARDVTIYDISVTPDDLDPLSQVTRAQLTMRMSLPPSGQYDNARDTFEINGYNARFKEQDYKDEMRDAIGSVPSRNAQYGYFLYGAGAIVEQSGFRDYRTELSFLDPNLPNGDLASITYRNIDIFNTMEFKIVGLPSGTLLSAAQLYLEYLPNEHLGLYTVGGMGLIRQFVPSSVDIGGLTNPLFGDGAWQHRGNLHEGTIFDAFYSFDEASGLYTYPTSLNAASGCYGEYINKIYEDIIYDNGVPIGANYTYYPVEPQRKNYYRNPVRTSFGTLYDPKYYRDMIYNGSPFLPFNIHNPNASRYSPNTAQVYFGNRLNIGVDFTLYFMVYREPTNEGQVFARLFQRSKIGSQGDILYEVIGILETEAVTFAIKDTNDGVHRVSIPIPAYGIEPLLIWFTCAYDTSTNKTTIKLNVHTDVRNYFSEDWLTAEKTFNFQRKQYQDVLTILGSLYSPQDLDQELAFSSFWSYTSLCEFGWADSALNLDWETSSDTIKDGYDISTDIEKQFFASRVCTNEYLQSHGINEDTIGGDPVETSGWYAPRQAWSAYGDILFGQLGWSTPWGIEQPGVVDASVASHIRNYTSIGIPEDEGSLFLVGYDFGINIPSGSVITGISAEYTVRKGASQLGDYGTLIKRVTNVSLGQYVDNYVNFQLFSDSTNQALSGPTEISTGWRPHVYGGPSNTWGLTFNGYQEAWRNLLQSPTFAIGFKAKIPDVGKVEVDYLRLKVHTTSISDPSGGEIETFNYLNWVVPLGSGAAQWSTQYKIDEWCEDEYQLYNPITTAGTHHIVHPSAIYIEIETEHNTNHPSGAQIICDIELDTGSTDNWKVFRTEFNIPSGALGSRVQGFTKHIGMNSEPVLYSDINQIGLNLTTKYADIGTTQYYGDLGIKCIKVYFDSYSASITGTSILPLYTYGTNATEHIQQDLFIEGHARANNGFAPRLDLYIYGMPYYGSGNIPLYTEGHARAPASGTTLYTCGIPYYGSGQMPLYLYNIPHQTITLFIEGLTPGSGQESAPLYTYATPAGVGGLYTTMPLYLRGALTNQSIPLYLGNTTLDTGTPNYSIPLYLQAAPLPTANMNLFLQAPSGEMRPGITFLYIRGLGTTDGALSTNTRCPLFIARDSESLAQNMSLYVAQARNWQTSDLYIQGISIVPSSVRLYIKGSGIPNETVKLYTHGF